jgi:hypothetical protein
MYGNRKKKMVSVATATPWPCMADIYDQDINLALRQLRREARIHTALAAARSPEAYTQLTTVVSRGRCRLEPVG